MIWIKRNRTIPSPLAAALSPAHSAGRPDFRPPPLQRAYATSRTKRIVAARFFLTRINVSSDLRLQFPAR